MQTSSHAKKALETSVSHNFPSLSLSLQKMNFEQFYSTWTNQLRHLVTQLTQAPRPPTIKNDQNTLQNLISKVMAHYIEFYRVKSRATSQDVLFVFGAAWTTSLERSLHWIAGWRPTTAFHLVYTESSILFETHVIDILKGMRTGDLGDLSPAQFRRVSELQCETVAEENAITDELSEWQDSSSDLIGPCPDIEGKMVRLARIVSKADDLRLRTIQRVVDMLTPQQAVEFLIAAAQLQFGVHTWGLIHDRGRRNM